MHSRNQWSLRWSAVFSLPSPRCFAFLKSQWYWWNKSSKNFGTSLGTLQGESKHVNQTILDQNLPPANFLLKAKSKDVHAFQYGKQTCLVAAIDYIALVQQCSCSYCAGCLLQKPAGVLFNVCLRLRRLALAPKTRLINEIQQMFRPQRKKMIEGLLHRRPQRHMHSQMQSKGFKYVWTASHYFKLLLV